MEEPDYARVRTWLYGIVQALPGVAAVGTAAAAIIRSLS